MIVNVVLVRGEYSRNIGAAARALANMGGDRLILIDPRCELDSKAKQMAAGAQQKFSERTQYASWEEFYKSEGEGLRIGFTRRGGRKRKVFPFKEKIIEACAGSPSHLYLIFGPEADGLAAEDLAFVNYACHLPVYGEFASLNLAQAVLLALYILRDQIPPATMPKQLTRPNDAAVQPLYFPDELIKDWISAIGFDVQARRASAYLTLRRLFLQNLPTQHELHVLESILQQNIRKLKEGSLGLALKEGGDDLGDITGEDV